MNEPQTAAAEGGAGAAGIGRIVVGFDERPASRDALALAAALGGASATDGAELIVASVRPYWPELIGAERYASVVADDEAWLAREATKLLGSRPFSTYVVGGEQEAAELKEIARSERADLIVVGSTHRGALGRVLPGSCGERVLDNAPCAVAVAPRGLAARGLRLGTVAVGYDGSREAAAALATAIELAGRCGAALRILAAVEFRFDLAGLPHSPDEVEERRLREQLERAAARVPAGIEATTRLLHGAPHRALPTAAAAADLLVLGSRGHYGRHRRLFLGSVAAQVTRGAPCATLLVPAP